jgi:hypothetical protein
MDRKHSDDRIAELLRAAGPRAAAPPERESRVRAAVEQTWRQRSARRPVARWALAASLAVAALAAALHVGVPRESPAAALATVEVLIGEPHAAVPGPHTLAQGMTLSAGATIRTRPGELVALRLADGRQLRLAPDSALRLHEVRRAELMAGRVYLDSPAGTRGSLALDTRFGTLTDVGTQYEAAIREDAAALRVRVREGRVLLGGAREDAALGVGDELTVGADGAATRGRIAPTDPEWDWVSAVAPPFALEGRSVDELARWVAREGGFALRYDSPATEVLARGAILHGGVTRVAPARLLDVVLPATRFEHEVADGTLVVATRGTP